MKSGVQQFHSEERKTNTDDSISSFAPRFPEVYFKVPRLRPLSWQEEMIEKDETVTQVE
jgi:hypothetical protein